MSLGFDSGTYTLVACQRDDQGNFQHKKEINAFIEFPIESRFVFNMMKNAGVPLIERKEAGVAYALGEAALDIAYTMNQIDIRRPMKDGCLNPKEKSAQQILSIMIHSLLDNVKKDNETLYYSVPANAINEETDADYHSKVLEAIFKAFKGENGFTVNPHPINEGLALVYAELSEKNWTGLGISCLCPGTKIYTDKGIVAIETVKEGDKVITHLGKWEEINKVITKQFSGTCTKIQLGGYSNNVEEYKFVDNHELYVNRDNVWQWVGCEEIKVGDIVGEPIIKQNRDATRPSINLCERMTCSKTWNKRQIESTPDLQRFIGYFLGDGSISEAEGCIQIDFNKHEIQFVEDVQKILEARFNKNSTPIEKQESVIRVKCYSRGLMNWMKNHCYDDQKEKCYPWTIDRLTNSECINLLCGMVRSDGTISDDQITFGNSNTKLTLLAKQLFSRIGLAASISWRGPRSHLTKENRMICGKKNEWLVSSAGKKVSLSIVDQFNCLDCESSRMSEKTFIENGFCCSRVQAIEHEEYEGEVYDLQVPGDHSFSGPFLTIHNCGAGMVNVCFAMYGAPIFQFSIVNSGDWIDRQAARATGETVAFINREKMKLDLSETSDVLVHRALKAQYEIMLQKTVTEIKKGLDKSGNKARTNDPIDIVIAGGTSCPKGFAQLFGDVVKKSHLPMEVGKIIRPKDPLYSVARGALIAAEAADQS